MTGYIDKIKEISKRLLADGAVDLVIGFCKGTVPMMNQPCIARTAEDVDRLVWDSNCGVNLANYLTHRAETIGIIAKGCDALGYKHGPLARNAPGCDGQARCAFGCPTDAKKSTNVSYVPAALKANPPKDAPEADTHKPYRASNYLRMVQGQGIWYESTHD